MADTPRVLLIMPQDTKGEEARYARDILEAEGVQVVHLDPSVRRTLGGAEIAPEAVAAAAGTTIEAIRAIGHEGRIQEVMIQGALACALDADKAAAFQGIFSIGGSMGTVISTTIMRAFPYGLPKLMVSSVASGFTKPYVGVKDIMMLNSVTDVSGLNSIAREVYRNAASRLRAWQRAIVPLPPATSRWCC